LCDLNLKNIALAIEAAKATAQEALVMTNTTNKQSEKFEVHGVATN